MRKCLAETFVSLCAVFVAPIACAEPFPSGDVFRPLIADPLEPRLFVSALNLDAPNDTLTAAEVGAGGELRLVPLGRRAPREGATSELPARSSRCSTSTPRPGT